MNTPDGGYVWFEVAGIDPAHERKLEEVRPEVEAAWRNDETQRILSQKATDMVKELQGGAISRRSRAPPRCKCSIPTR